MVLSATNIFEWDGHVWQAYSESRVLTRIQGIACSFNQLVLVCSEECLCSGCRLKGVSQSPSKMIGPIWVTITLSLKNHFSLLLLFPTLVNTSDSDLADYSGDLRQELSPLRIPFNLAQVWFASMYWEPSTTYTRCLYAKCLHAWMHNLPKDDFLRRLPSDLELREAYTMHIRRHGPYSIDVIPLALPDEEIIEC